MDHKVHCTSTDIVRFYTNFVFKIKLQTTVYTEPFVFIRSYVHNTKNTCTPFSYTSTASPLATTAYWHGSSTLDRINFPNMPQTCQGHHVSRYHHCDRRSHKLCRFHPLTRLARSICKAGLKCLCDNAKTYAVRQYWTIMINLYQIYIYTNTAKAHFNHSQFGVPSTLAVLVHPFLHEQDSLLISLFQIPSGTC